MARSKFYLLKKSDFPGLMKHLSGRFRIFAPVMKDGEYNFKEVMPGGREFAHGLPNSYINTEFPPKSLLMPEGEKLLEYGGKGETIRAEGRSESIIFGVRPCDTHAFDVLDKVMTGQHADSHYDSARRSLVVFALDCTKAGKECFCGSMGTREAEKFDLLFTDEGANFHVEAGSAKGMEITKLPLFRKTGRKAKKAKLVFRKRLETRNLDKIMNESFASDVWKSASERCLSCASCTNVCPTCYCFDMPHSKPLGANASVRRISNYCMIRDFTRVAGGGVFRGGRDERLKQFFYHKLVYGKKNQGKYHCVGCGRCIKECMTRIDITEEVAKVRREYERRKPL